MKFFSVVVVVELMLSLIFLTAKHPAVLGAREIAQVDTSATDIPTDTPTDQPVSSYTSTPIDTSSPIDTSTPQDTSLEAATPIETSIPFTETPIETLLESPVPTSLESASSEVEVSPLSDQAIAVLDSSSTITNINNVDQNVIQQIMEQNQQSDTAITPEKQVQTSVNAGQTDVQTIGSSLNKSNFSNVNLITEDLSQHIDKSLSVLNQTFSDQKLVLKQNLTNLCTNATISLRSSEEMVLEESEQDMEMVRAKCFNVLNQQ